MIIVAGVEMVNSSNGMSSFDEAREKTVPECYLMSWQSKCWSVNLNLLQDCLKSWKISDRASEDAYAGGKRDKDIQGIQSKSGIAAYPFTG